MQVIECVTYTISVQCAREMRSPEICKANAVKELLVTHDVLLQNQWNNMAVDVFFALCYLGVQEFLTSLRNCSTESQLWSRGYFILQIFAYFHSVTRLLSLQRSNARVL